MARGVDHLDELRTPLGLPPQDEERARHCVTFEQLQDSARVGDDTALVGLPALSLDGSGKCADLIPVLDIDAQGVSDGRVRSHAASRYRHRVEQPHAVRGRRPHVGKDEGMTLPPSWPAIVGTAVV